MRDNIKNVIIHFFRSRISMSVIALTLLLLFNLLFTPGFFTIQINNGHLYGSLIDILKNGTPLILVSMGMTLVMATGGADISVGSVAALSAMVIAQLYAGTFSFAVGNAGQNTGFPLGLAIAIGLFVALLCGTFNGFLVAYLDVEPFIATLIMQAAARGLAYIVSDGRVVTVHGEQFQFFGGGYLLGIPFSVYIVFTVVIIIFLFVRKTAYGLYLEAVGSNKKASYFSGIRITVIIWLAYALTGLLAGGAGFLLSSNVSSSDANMTGMNLELDAIMACVLGGNSMNGGRFSFLGSFIGALIVQTLTITIYTKGAPSESILLFKAFVVMLVGIIQMVDINGLKKKYFEKVEVK